MGSFPYSVAIEDLNRDGKPDLVAGNVSSGTVSVLLGAGGGTFGAKTDFVLGADPRSVAIGTERGWSSRSGDGKLLLLHRLCVAGERTWGVWVEDGLLGAAICVSTFCSDQRSERGREI